MTVRAEFPRRGEENAFVSRLWATRRIGELSRQLRLEGSNPEVIEEIRTLALRHGILTEYTSYLVLEPGMDPRNPATPMPMPIDRAAAPSSFGNAQAQAGAGAVARAEESQAMAKSSSLADADAAARRRVDQMLDARALAATRDGREAERVVTRQVGGRTFVSKDGVWTDALHQAGRGVVKVKPYGKAYFEMVRALPEIVPALQAGDQVIVAGRRVSIQLAADGLERWDAGALARVVRNFRGQ
jgi:Ca-activated chloride channel family protein